MINSFKDLYKHYGHEVVVARYENTINETINVAIECQDCYEVLVNYDKQTKH
jgi:hypothetical protein